VALLEVRDLHVVYETEAGPVHAVHGVSFAVYPAEAVGLVGESGCGKTTLGLSLLRLLPVNGKIVSGDIIFEGTNLTKIAGREMRRIRGREISMAFQGAMNALNPVIPVGRQIVDGIILQTDLGEKAARQWVAELFDLLGIGRSRIDDYPHQLSGGLKQRVMIAMGLSCDPSLLIADEPVTALDVMVQAQILRLIADLIQRLNLTMILITHDLSVVAETCDRVVVMYAGKIMEICRVQDEFLHPYTRLLFRAFPDIHGERQALKGIPGAPPNLLEPPPGCPFADRCPAVEPICREVQPPLIEVDQDHQTACHFVQPDNLAPPVGV
jgi:peptide/nickel transport system ATP-binding protein